MMFSPIFVIVFGIASTSVSPIKMQLNTTGNSTDLRNHPSYHCTYQTLQYCHRYIRNIFLLYTGIGGWVLFGIILAGILLQIHFLVTGRNADGILTLRRRDLKYEMAQMRRNKKNSFMSKWAAEIGRGHPYSP